MGGGSLQNDENNDDDVCAACLLAYSQDVDGVKKITKPKVIGK